MSSLWVEPLIALISVIIVFTIMIKGLNKKTTIECEKCGTQQEVANGDLVFHVRNGPFAVRYYCPKCNKTTWHKRHFFQ